VGVRPNSINLGDCVAKLKEVDAGSIDLVFADPPFNIGYEYDLYHDRRSAEEYLDWSRDWMTLVHSRLKSSGTFWLAIGDEFAAELKVLAQQLGFHCRSWVIWYYTFGVNCARGFSRSHTHLFHFVKDREEFTFNGDNPAVRVLSARQLVYADGRANPKGRLPDNTWIFRPQDAPFAFTSDHDTWYFARVAGTFKERQGFHGCQMPEQLLGRIIRISSNPNDVVLDPFAGSGTTLAVAKELGRQYIGLELSEDYVCKIEQRLETIEVGDPLDGPADPVRSAPSTKQGKKRVRLHKGRPLPEADPETEQEIIDAYQETARGYSADYLLCDPMLSADFQQECKRRKLPGGPFVCNRLLLRLRKAGRLPKATINRRRYTFAEMDAYSFASEIALRQLEIDQQLRLDDILCSPDAVREFDRYAAELAPGRTPFEYRWAALAIRKRAIESKSLAEKEFRNWLTEPLPEAFDIEEVDAADFERPGAYIFSSESETLYAGEGENVRVRVELARSTTFWQKVGLTSVTFLPCDGQRQHGLQSILIGRLRPLLNSRLLVPGLPKRAESKRSNNGELQPSG